MATYLQQEKRRYALVWVAVILVAVVTFSLCYMFTDSPPPNKIRLATGESPGGYEVFGRKYADILRKNGLDVEFVGTSGSVDNYRLLREGKVDAAFMQGGTYDPSQDTDSEVCGIASLYREPLWVIYRSVHEITDVAEFRDKTISLGPVGSGADAIARLVLEANGINEDNSKLLNLTMNEAATKLGEGEIDVTFIVSSYENAVVPGLLDNEQLRLMSFRRHGAYTRILPFLTSIELPEGVLDLSDNVPARPTTVLAPAAILTCRRDLHPRVVEQLLTAARITHCRGNLVDKPGQFPSLDGVDMPVHETADAYLKSGESLVSRFVPYWALPWLVRAQLFIIPALALWIPFFRILPLLYRLRIGGLLKAHYAALRDVETVIERADSPHNLRQSIRTLETLREDMERLSRKIPAYYQRDVYNWRLHVSMVLDQATQRLDSASSTSRNAAVASSEQE
jgi:TRAP transporter TAXI family solute receptor